MCFFSQKVVVYPVLGLYIYISILVEATQTFVRFPPIPLLYGRHVYAETIINMVL